MAAALRTPALLDNPAFVGVLSTFVGAISNLVGVAKEAADRLYLGNLPEVRMLAAAASAAYAATAASAANAAASAAASAAAHTDITTGGGRGRGKPRAGGFLRVCDDRADALGGGGHGRSAEGGSRIAFTACVCMHIARKAQASLRT